MDEKRRMHRFRFTLRTLFVLITLVAIWLGWSLNWIRQRHEFLRDRRGFVLDTDPEAFTLAPRCLWLFGEEGAEFVWLISKDPLADARAKELFPEATVLGYYTVFNWDRWFKDRATKR